MSKRRFLYSVAVLLFVLSSLNGVLAAENYPSREIQLIIPTGIGSFVDTAARLISGNLAKILGVPVVISNRSGESLITHESPAGPGRVLVTTTRKAAEDGAIATASLVKSKPDGYTIAVLSSLDAVLIPATTPSVPFKYADIDPVCKFLENPAAVFCKTDAPWKSIDDLVADTKKRPGKITYGAATQSISYFQIEGFMAAAGINMTHVPMQHIGQTIQKIMGGNLDIGIGYMANLTGQFKAGTLRPLLLMAPARMKTFPQIPIANEKGYQNPILVLYAGFFLPLGTPKPVKEVLEKALEKAIKEPSLNSKLENVFLELDYLPADAYAKQIEDDYRRVITFMKTLGQKN